MFVKTAVVEIIKRVIKKHRTSETINIDLESQFTSDEYINIMNSNNIKKSIDGKHRTLDNQMMEFFDLINWEIVS